MGGNVVSGSFASYVVRPGEGRSGIGNIVRAWRSGLMVVSSGSGDSLITFLEVKLVRRRSSGHHLV